MKHPQSKRLSGKRSRKAALRERGLELRAKYPRQVEALVCPLCGLVLPKGSVLEHKAVVHGEKKFSASPVRRRSPNAWVSVVGGGLPSLGKRRR